MLDHGRRSDIHELAVEAAAPAPAFLERLEEIHRAFKSEFGTWRYSIDGAGAMTSTHVSAELLDQLVRAAWDPASARRAHELLRYDHHDGHWILYEQDTREERSRALVFDVLTRHALGMSAGTAYATFASDRDEEGQVQPRSIASGSADARRKRYAMTFLAGEYLEALTGKKSAAAAWEKACSSPFYDEAHRLWYREIPEDEAARRSPFYRGEDQLLGVLLRTLSDPRDAQARYAALRSDHFYDESRSVWLGLAGLGHHASRVPNVQKRDALVTDQLLALHVEQQLARTPDRTEERIPELLRFQNA